MMSTVSAVLNILALNIILALVLAILYREKNNAFGHALSQDEVSLEPAETAVRPQIQGNS